MKMKAAAVALLAGATMLVAPSGASASPADDVHYCLSAYPSSGHAYVWYRNNSCGGRAIRSKVVVSWGPDSDCKTLSPGQSYTHDWIVGSWDGLVPC
jgi:hypothetical protein